MAFSIKSTKKTNFVFDGEAAKRERSPYKSFTFLLYAVKSPRVKLMENDSVFMTH